VHEGILKLLESITILEIASDDEGGAAGRAGLKVLTS
jgi:hypothetical protein